MLPPPSRRAALSPVAFLERAASVFPGRTGVVDGERRWTWAQLAERARRLAVALQQAGIGHGDRVAIVAPSSPELLEAHFGVPAAGAVLVAVDGRLAEAEIADMLERSLVRLLVVDAGLEPLGAAAAGRAGVPRVLVCGPGADSYEAFLAGARGDRPAAGPVFEEDVLSVTYGAAAGDGTAGVATTHRAAYLDALAEVHHARLDTRSVYLWTVPLLHAGGGVSFPWAVTAAAAKHVCVREVDEATLGRRLAEEGVTHLGALPSAPAPAEPAPPTTQEPLWSRGRAEEAPGFRIRRVPVALEAGADPALALALAAPRRRAGVAA